MAKKRTQHYKKYIEKAPGTLVYTGTKPKKDLHIEYYDYTNTSIEIDTLKNINDVAKFKNTNSTTWININGLHYTKEIEAIGKLYNIHPLALEDIVNTSQRPKIDEYDNYLFIVLKMLYYNANENIVVEQVAFILGKNYVLTFQEAEGDVFNSIRERLRFGKGRVRTTESDYLLYALMDAVVDNYFSIIETLGNKIEDLENQLFQGNVKEDINIEIQQLKREILRVRRAIFPLRDIASRLLKDHVEIVHPNTLNYYRDLHDHLTQVSENIDIYRDMIWSLMDMYMTTISNKMNEVMKVLTIIATIFIPLTFIAGVYGMNFKYLPELEYKYGYHLFWLAVIVLFLVMFIYFKRKKWL